MNYFVDTNIFLRFLARDNEEQFKDCRKLFQKAKDGQVNLTTSALVIFELVWTLIYYYDEPKDAVVEKILSILEFPNLAVEHKDIFLEALLIWQQKNMEFNDAFNYIWSRKKEVSGIYSYDKHFDKLPTANRLEP